MAKQTVKQARKELTLGRDPQSGSQYHTAEEFQAAIDDLVAAVRRETLDELIAAGREAAKKH